MNTHVEIRRPAFSTFLKAEVAEFAKSAIGIIENQDPESLLISPVFNPLIALSPEIELLSVSFGVDPQRAKVETLKSKLMLNVSTLKLQVRLLSKGGVDEGLYTIKKVVDTYLRHLNAVKVNDKVVVQKVEGFVNSVSTDAALAEGIEKHNLMPFIASIKLALSAFRSAVSKRNATLAGRPKLNTPQTIAKVSHAVHTLFKGVEIAQLMNPELDYSTVVDELNELVDDFRVSIRLRASYNRRKAEEEKNRLPNDDGAKEGTPSENGATTMQTTSFRPSSGFAPFHLGIAEVSEVVGPEDEADATASNESKGAVEPSESTVEVVEVDEA